MFTRTVILFFCLGCPCLALSDSMRCSKWVVNETTPPAELLDKCGEPERKDISKEDVLGLNSAGNPIRLGVQVTERWHYKRSAGSLPMLVTIVDGKTKSIEREE